MRHAKFTTLDGMRGVAALVVAIFHYCIYRDMSHGYQIFYNGGFAVDLFFVLSGFVLAHAYEPRFAAGMSTTRYMLVRLIRLYPMYIAGSAIAIAMELYLTKAGYYARPVPMALLWHRAALGVLFLPVIWPMMSFYPFNFPAWSLLLEIVANLAHRLAIRRLAMPALVAVMAVSFIGILMSPDHGDLGITSASFYLSRVFFSFFAGILTYRIWSISTFRPSLPPWLFVGAVLLCLTVRFGPVVYFVFPALIYLGASVEPTGITRKIFKFMGSTSYSVYMLHYPLMRVVEIAWPRITKMPAIAAAPWIMAPTLALTVITAFVFDKIYDGPVRDWLSGQLRKTRSRMIDGATAEFAG